MNANRKPDWYFARDAAGVLFIRYSTDGLPPMAFDSIASGKKAKKHAHVMPVEVAQLTVNADISDAEASQIIHERLEEDAVIEQDSMYAAEMARKCAAIAEFGLQVVNELRVGDRFFSWHKAAYDAAPAFHDSGVVMTPVDEFGRLYTQRDGVYSMAPRTIHTANMPAPYYVQRSAYQWNSANTRFTEELAALMSPATEAAFMDTFAARLDAVIDVLAPDMLAEGNERRRAFAEMRESEIRQQVTDSNQEAAA